MIVCSAFLFAPLTAVHAAALSGFGFELARADYGKIPKRSNRNLQKIAGGGRVAIKTLHPRSGFGFILAVPDSRQLSCPP